MLATELAALPSRPRATLEALASLMTGIDGRLYITAACADGARN